MRPEVALEIFFLCCVVVGRTLFALSGSRLACCEVSAVASSRLSARDREKARGDVFGVLDLWAG